MLSSPKVLRIYTQPSEMGSACFVLVLVFFGESWVSEIISGVHTNKSAGSLFLKCNYSGYKIDLFLFFAGCSLFAIIRDPTVWTESKFEEFLQLNSSTVAKSTASTLPESFFFKHSSPVKWLPKDGDNFFIIVKNPLWPTSLWLLLFRFLVLLTITLRKPQKSTGCWRSSCSVSVWWGRTLIMHC